MVNIICGHYGCGKTNLCLNLAIMEKEKGGKVAVYDMDIVNPYFRTSDYKNILEKMGIEVVSPNFANTTSDVPSISAQIRRAFIESDTVSFIDLGGDDAGAMAISQFREDIKDYNMIYVINQRRNLTTTPQETIDILREIERATGLKVSGIVNNTHLGADTSLDVIQQSIPYAKEVCRLTGLPLLYTTALDFLDTDECLKISRLVKSPWE